MTLAFPGMMDGSGQGWAGLVWCALGFNVAELPCPDEWRALWWVVMGKRELRAKLDCGSPGAWLFQGNDSQAVNGGILTTFSMCT